MSNLDAAEVDLLRLAPFAWAHAAMPSILAHVRRHLRDDDPRRLRVEEIAARVLTNDMSPYDRGMVISAARAASSEQRRGVLRLRSLRNVLAVAIGLLAFGSAAFGLVGAWHPEWIPLCFNPTDGVVCPTANEPLQENASLQDVDDAVRNTVKPLDIFLIELIGLIAAAVAAATTLRGLRRTTGAYDFPLMLAILKLPTGALTAVLGLLLMRAQFVPGLSALDSSAQILAWAVVLGYSQQVFTRLVDRSTQEALQEHEVTQAIDGAPPRPSPGPQVGSPTAAPAKTPPEDAASAQ